MKSITKKGLVEWSKVEALSLSPSTVKTTKKEICKYIKIMVIP
jgi:DNA-binding CsgD family transcriptional regulator